MLPFFPRPLSGTEAAGAVWLAFCTSILRCSFPFPVYSASNLLVLLNDWILRKDLQKSLPVVRLECVGRFGICFSSCRSFQGASVET